jgi:hypothetical protein
MRRYDRDDFTGIALHPGQIAIRDILPSRTRDRVSTATGIGPSETF